MNVIAAAIHGETLTQMWAALESTGWDDGHQKLSLIYPMPGDPRFDDDEAFLNQPLFPGPDGTIIRVADDRWEFPIAWLRAYETRPDRDRRIDFSLVLNDGTSLAKHQSGSTLILAWKRVMYLEIFRLRKPHSLSTFRGRRFLYGAFVRYAAENGLDLQDLSYLDLANVVATLGGMQRKSLRAAYDALRWWKAQPGSSYGFFDPPPSVQALSQSGTHIGFDTTRIREDEEEKEDNKWQPLPDPFVAALGEVMLALIEKVRPVLNKCCRELATLRRQSSKSHYKLTAPNIIHTYPWPQGYAPKDMNAFTSLAYDCQTATQILVSLLLGPRASEMLALPGQSVRKLRTSEGSIWIIDGATFKLSSNFGGEERDWPLHPIAGEALSKQREYVKITEGPGFSWLWKSHVRIFGAKSPVKQSLSQLLDFATRHNLVPLLEGTSFHHHRFRKTVARLIVIALHGGPLVLRRLFGHEHLAMTLRYILADETIVAELREIAEQEQRKLAAEFVARKDELTGKGGEAFRAAVQGATEAILVTVPDGKRDQAEVTIDEIVEFLGDGADGLTIKQIIPGLIGCFKPRDEAGACCSAGELPNVAQCDAECKWQAMLPEFRAQAVTNVRDALNHISADPANPLVLAHYEGVVLYWVRRFPDIAREFTKDMTFERILGVPNGPDC